MANQRLLTSTFNRPPRIRPVCPLEEVELPEPPQPLRRDPLNWLVVLMPVAGVVVLIMAMGLISQGGSAVFYAVPMGAMALVGVVTAFVSNREQNKRSAARCTPS